MKSHGRIIFLVVLLLTLPWLQAQPPAESPKLEGIWLGPLKTGAMDMRIAFHFKRKADVWAVTMDSLDQGARGLKVDEVVVQDGMIRLEIKVAKASFEGKVNAATMELEGTWKQSGLKLPLVLKRVEKLPEPRRPQEPKRPFPYREEEISYENTKAKVHFAGTLTIPQGDGPFPAVVMITGSGPQDRNEELLGHKPFLLIADYLTRRGIAVVRVDDRGVGGSTGNINESTTADFAEDVLAGVDFLKKRKEIDGTRIGLIGHSEGGVIAPLAASQSKDVAFIVLLAGTGLPGDEIVRRQSRLIAQAGGASTKNLDLGEKYLGVLLRVVMAEEDQKVVERKVKEKLAEWKEQATAEADKKSIDDLESAFMKIHLKTFVTKWFRYFLSHDPAPALGKVTCPVLALNGEKDLQVPCTANLTAIAQALAAAENPDFTIRRFPKLNHLFQTCKTGSPAEYALIEETMAPVVLETIGDWIIMHTKKR